MSFETDWIVKQILEGRNKNLFKVEGQPIPERTEEQLQDKVDARETALTDKIKSLEGAIETIKKDLEGPKSLSDFYNKHYIIIYSGLGIIVALIIAYQTLIGINVSNQIGNLKDTQNIIIENQINKANKEYFEQIKQTLSQNKTDAEKTDAILKKLEEMQAQINNTKAK